MSDPELRTPLAKHRPSRQTFLVPDLAAPPEEVFLEVPEIHVSIAIARAVDKHDIRRNFIRTYLISLSRDENSMLVTSNMRDTVSHDPGLPKLPQKLVLEARPEEGMPEHVEILDYPDHTREPVLMERHLERLVEGRGFKPKALKPDDAARLYSMLGAQAVDGNSNNN
jgi:hypothetical protein